MFELTCSSFLFKANVRHHLTKFIDLEEFEHFIERLILNLCVGDSTTSVDQLSDAIEFYRVAKLTLGDANFDLRKWISNNFEFHKHVHIKNNGDMELAKLDDHRKVLGLQWQLSTDKTVYLSMNLLNCSSLRNKKY